MNIFQLTFHAIISLYHNLSKVTRQNTTLKYYVDTPLNQMKYITILFYFFISVFLNMSMGHEL